MLWKLNLNFKTINLNIYYHKKFPYDSAYSIFPLYINAQNPKHYQASSELESALRTLNSFVNEVNDSGWNDAYDVKRSYNILQRAEAKIDLTIDTFDEIVTDIEKIENKDFSCLEDSSRVETTNAVSDLKKLKYTLNNAIDNLYDIDTYPKCHLGFTQSINIRQTEDTREKQYQK